MKELDKLLHIERGMLSPEDTQRYYLHLSDLARRGEYELDEQTFWSMPAWYMPFLDIHEVCHDKMEEVCGIELEGSYCYARRYSSGTYLFPHTDRPECRASLTINLGHGGENWSIWAGSPENPIFLEPGDALIYNGATQEHGREYMRIDQRWMYQIFVHYMPLEDAHLHLQHEGFVRTKEGTTTAKRFALGTLARQASIIDD